MVMIMVRVFNKHGLVYKVSFILLHVAAAAAVAVVMSP